MRAVNFGRALAGIYLAAGAFVGVCTADWAAVAVLWSGAAAVIVVVLAAVAMGER